MALPRHSAGSYLDDFGFTIQGNFLNPGSSDASLPQDVMDIEVDVSGFDVDGIVRILGEIRRG